MKDPTLQQNVNSSDLLHMDGMRGFDSSQPYSEESFMER